MARPVKALNLSEEQRGILQGMARSRETPHSQVVRSQIILKAAEGINHKKISQEYCVRMQWVFGVKEGWKAALSWHNGRTSPRNCMQR